MLIGRRRSWLSLFVLLLVASCSGTQKTTSSKAMEQSIRQELSVFSTSTRHAPNLKKPPSGPFGLSMVSSIDGKPTSIDTFDPSDACAECHPRQWKELKGSMHSVTHIDTLYRRTAELARKEAGEKVYGLCSGCHTPQGVTSGLVPRVPEEKLPEIVKAGVVCDTCHQTSHLTGKKGPWKEPGNASIVLDPGTKRGPLTGDDEGAEHPIKSVAFFQKSEFCASCHTVIHPFNGVRLEHTYSEWKKSVYARKGIQCQDCHMRSVEQAKQVAQTLQRIVPRGKSTEEGKERPVGLHYFVGGGSHADRLGGDKVHAKMAQTLLQNAATLSLKLPEYAVPGKTLMIEVIVTNIGAGHNLPTSFTEFREMWVDLELKDAEGSVIFHVGALDKNGDTDPNTTRFGAKGADSKGRLTYKPWEVTHFGWERLIPPKTAARDAYLIPLPSTITSKFLVITAQLYYRAAPPAFVKTLLTDEEVRTGQGLQLPPVKMTSTQMRIGMPAAVHLDTHHGHGT